VRPRPGVGGRDDRGAARGFRHLHGVARLLTGVRPVARDAANPTSDYGSDPGDDERLKNEFFTYVTHELRTPLTSIVGYAELLLEDDDIPVEQRRKFLGVINRNGRRMLRLVGDLLFVAKAESGEVYLDRREVDVAEIARQSVETFTPRAGRDGLELKAEIEETGTIVGDPGRIGQVLDNLVSNAIKFTPEGGVVTVRARRSGPDAVAIEVADTGPGVPEADRERLFDRFYRTIDASDRAIEGTGLGLTIVKTIVDGHGGKVSVGGGEGDGATFAIELPVGEAPADVHIVGEHE
jgi:signal transduction histidine kinase